MENEISEKKIKTIGIIVLVIFAFYLGYDTGKSNDGSVVKEKEFSMYGDLNFGDYEGEDSFNVDGYAKDLMNVLTEDFNYCLNDIIKEKEKTINDDIDEGINPFSILEDISEDFYDKCRVEE